MAPRRIGPGDLGDVLPPGGLTWLQACSAESKLLRQGLTEAGDRLGAMTFTGIFVPGLNRIDYAVTGERRVTTFFMTPELKHAGDRVEFLPLCYRDILRHLRSLRIDAALFMVSPPDGEGNCSFGPVVDFLAELWPRIPIRIAHVNPCLPRTHGHPGIPYSQLTAVVEGEEDLATAPSGRDEASDRIGQAIAPLVADRATIQAGLGRIPEAVMSNLTDRRGLAVHSGLIGDATLELLQAGALRAQAPVTAGVAIGSRRLYDALGDEAFSFRPVSHTHSLAVLASIDRLITINSALEVDLFGQAFAELTPNGFMSGPGGASDFAAGARSIGGLRILALPATARKGQISRIVGPGAGSGPVSLSRFDIDLVATEHGIADLRGKSHDGRAEALMSVAAPQWRGELADRWRDWSRQRAD
jgi:acyl-CoA hydrolase